MAEPSIAAFMESLSLAQHNRERAQLEAAVSHGQTALAQVPSRSSTRIELLIHLAILHTELYGQSFDIATLNDAIKYNQEVVDLTLTGNPHRGSRLIDLSIQLYTRYKREGKLEDLTQAIKT